MPDEPTPPTQPELPDDSEKPDKPLPMILTLADITSWDIGPGRESDCQLKITITVKDFENTKLIRALAAGKVVLRLLPLQLKFGEGTPPAPDPEGCLHPINKLWDFAESPTDKTVVCMECGLVITTPKTPPPDPNAEPPVDEEPPAADTETPPPEPEA